MKTRRVIKVEPFYLPAGNYWGATSTRASQIRLKGKWLSEIFPPNTRVRVTLIESPNGIGIALEPIEEPPLRVTLIESVNGSTERKEVSIA